MDLDRLELDLGFGRGIGFYSQMIFEVNARAPGGLVEVCGGGRYDGLARVFGSDRDDRGVGFAFGLERLDQVLQAQGARTKPPSRSTFLIVPPARELFKEAVLLATTLRSRGYRAILEAGWQGRELAERARAVGASWSVILGEPGAASPMLLLDHARQTTKPTTVETLIGLADCDEECPS